MQSTALDLTPSPSQGPNIVPQSQHWLARARQCRAIADRMRNEFAREHMLKAADSFELEAQESREREIAHGISRMGELVRGLRRGV
jgi:hypothetical protein